MSTKPPASTTMPPMVAWLAAGFAVLDIAILAVFHILQPGVDPLTQPTSHYVHGTAGFAALIGTVAAGLGALCLVLALRPARTGRRAGVGLALLAVFGIAKVVQAFFPIDPAEAEATTAGAVHNVLGNVAFFTLPVAVVLLGGLVAALTGRRVSSVLALVVVVTTVGVLVASAAGAFGLAQRVYLLAAAVWMLATALSLLHPHQRRG